MLKKTKQKKKLEKKSRSMLPSVLTEKPMPKALVLTGYGINCDEETKFAFDKAGAKAEIIHINDLIDKHRNLSDYKILAFPGGFSYGDDTGSGNALANKIKNNLWEELMRFVEDASSSFIHLLSGNSGRHVVLRSTLPARQCSTPNSVIRG